MICISTEEKKKCCHCKLFLSKDNFNKNKSASDGLSFECRICRTQYRKKWYNNLTFEQRATRNSKNYYRNKDYYVKYQKQYACENRDKMTESHNKWKAKNEAHVKKYLQEN